MLYEAKHSDGIGQTGGLLHTCKTRGEMKMRMDSLID